MKTRLIAGTAIVAVFLAVFFSLNSPIFAQRFPHRRGFNRPIPITSSDRVYTADQSSNTVSVINPATNQVLGTIPLGEPRLDGVLGPVDRNQVNVHGLGFSRDGRYIDVVSVTSNAAQVIDTSTNKVVGTYYVGRSPHEAFISPNGKELWVAVRGQDYVSVIDLSQGKEVDRIQTTDGPSKVVFSPDGRRAFVNHLFSNVLDVIGVRNRNIERRIPIPEEAGGSSDLSISPDGEQVWLGHPGTGKTTVVDAQQLEVVTVLDSGPRTNHPNFVNTKEGEFAYVTVGDLNQTKVYRRGRPNQVPKLVDTIKHTGFAPHGIWASGDYSRVYVALQKSDSVDVIDTSKREVIDTIQIGQDPQALIFVTGAVPSGTDESANLTKQGLGRRVKNLKIETRGVEPEYAIANIRDLGDVDGIDVRLRGLPPNESYTIWASDGNNADAILNINSNDKGIVPEAIAFTKFFENYDRVILTPKGQQL
ncbi:MAG: beta-propeller fold lactonase family protein [Rivularia sp. (in: Bacteria)]|nr:beta-propeller fold lactonase family protein [Rivularia sp. MS3]